MKPTFKWSLGNNKLKKLGTIGFSLPALKSRTGKIVCIGAGKCAGPCFARQGFFAMPNVIDAAEYNLELLLNITQNEAIEALSCDIDILEPTSIRIHPGGDFYSQAYYDTWRNVAGRFPNVLFYAYTKSLMLDLHRRDNLKITKSLGGKWDWLIEEYESKSRIFATDEDRIKAGYINGNVDDSPAMRGDLRIGLVYHGSRKLKEGEANQWR